MDWVTLLATAAFGLALTLVTGFCLALALAKGRKVEPYELVAFTIILGILVPPLVLLGLGVAFGLRLNDYATVAATYAAVAALAFGYWRFVPLSL